MPSQAAAGALAHRRVLVVEDEYFIGEEMSQALRHLGAEVVGPMTTIPKVLDCLASGERIDVAVLDINLHGETSYAVADALKERDVPFVFVTGYDEAAIPAGYRGVPRWEKPFNANNLAGALPRILRPVTAARDASDRIG